MACFGKFDVYCHLTAEVYPLFGRVIVAVRPSREWMMHLTFANKNSMSTGIGARYGIWGGS